MSTDYQDTIAEYLAKKENFGYALEISSNIDSAKAILRRRFWNTLRQMCNEYLEKDGNGLFTEFLCKEGPSNDVWFLYICHKVRQDYSLKYGFEDDKRQIIFGVYYSKERYHNGQDMFADINGLAPLSNLLAEKLTQPDQNSLNEWTLRWSPPLGKPYEETDLRRIAEDPIEYASGIFEQFKSVFEVFGKEIMNVNQALARLKAPAENSK